MPATAAAAAAPTAETPVASVASDSPAASAPTAPAAPGSTTTGVRKIEQRDVEPLDLMGTAGPAMLKRLVPAGILGVVLILILRRLFR